MYELHLDMFQVAGIAALLYWLGSFIVKKSSFLSKYCIPAPLVGGLIFAVLNTILTVSGAMTIVLDTTLQNILMSVFFTTIGFSASFALIRNGGKQILVILLLSVIVLTFQNGIGTSIAALFGIDARLGLSVGSISLMGGPGTAAAFGATMESAPYLVSGASAVGLTAATFGLIAGSILGGPIMRRRLDKLGFKDGDAVVENTEVPNTDDSSKFKTSTDRFVFAAMLLALALGIGVVVSQFISLTGITFPAYMGSLIMGAVIRNIVDAFGDKYPNMEVEVCGEISLSLFLAMAMMGLKLWVLADLALPIIVILIAQVTFMFLFSYFVLFNMLGKDYEAAVQTAGFIGYAMGSMSNAMANMQTITKKYGYAPAAYLAVPIGGMMSDFFNAVIITGFLNFLS